MAEVWYIPRGWILASAATAPAQYKVVPWESAKEAAAPEEVASCPPTTIAEPPADLPKKIQFREFL